MLWGSSRGRRLTATASAGWTWRATWRLWTRRPPPRRRRAARPRCGCTLAARRARRARVPDGRWHGGRSWCRAHVCAISRSARRRRRGGRPPRAARRKLRRNQARAAETAAACAYNAAATLAVRLACRIVMTDRMRRRPRSDSSGACGRARRGGGRGARRALEVLHAGTLRVRLVCHMEPVAARDVAVTDGPCPGHALGQVQRTSARDDSLSVQCVGRLLWQAGKAPSVDANGAVLKPRGSAHALSV